ncbi:Dcm Site-specific DNA methylase [uncultured Caudovirales phage]|uniref:Cytosine-specific methyltransferase n=1 Tax=uncultured Caudovirales phage TaxID=2100421 RepID=A0A6J5QUC7_9CAUD|nr:Dcm Site-specific DNA methylase [uncultured Caudovirales phage]CAB4199790.1 Dcm Site-specific DNA methylase [uncultured Caudovirales phage]CAB4218488.1 Dcm Site-specific DNA methylase [uncultured Caudovirales phage]
MRYLSVCSGIEAASVAWHPLGWEPVAFSEIEKFPSAVLAHHYPGVPNWGDMTKFKEWPDATIDLLVGGTPCQSFSVAGLRKGLADPRGNLALTYLALADRYRPEWLVWENVPGVLSADNGEAFGAFLGGLGELGYGWAYRVLDAQYWGLAQRRKRVFVVASLGGWQRAAAVLFDSASLRGDSAPRREAREGIANAITERPDRGGGNSEGQRLIAATAPTLQSQRTGGGGPRGDFHYDGGLIPEVVGTLSDGAHMGGGLNGQDAYSGRIFAVRGEPVDGAHGEGHQHDVRRGTDVDRGFL